MKLNKLGICLACTVVLGISAWVSWRWYTTPLPPPLALADAEPAVSSAIEAAREKAISNPRSGAAWGALAMTLIANGYREEALPCLAYAERFDSRNPRWPYFHGIQMYLTRPKAGVTSLEKALALASTQDQRHAILFRLGLFLIELGELRAAEPHVQALEAAEPGSPRVTFLHGLAAMAHDDRITARACLSTLTDSPYAGERACNLMATITHAEPTLSRGYQRKAAQLPPDIPWPDPLMNELIPLAMQRATRFTKIRALASQGRIPEATQLLKELAEESPDPECHNKLAEAYLYEGQLALAEDILREVLRRDGKDLKANYLFGACLLTKGEKQLQLADGKASAFTSLRQAVEAADLILAAYPNHADAHLLRGRALTRLGQIGPSLHSLRQAVLCRPEFTEAYVELGEVLAAAGRMKEAIEQLTNAVRVGGLDQDRQNQILRRWRANATAKPRT